MDGKKGGENQIALEKQSTKCDAVKRHGIRSGSKPSTKALPGFFSRE